jgi:peptide-methionine (S)-S-oxide reductase
MPTHGVCRHLVRIALLALLAASLLAACGVSGSGSTAPDDARAVPSPLLDEPPGRTQSEVAVLAGGCFWGVQGVFQHVTGVSQAVSGHAGGSRATAVYEMVKR